MKKLITVFAVLAGLSGFAAPDDTAVANRKWVRELLAKHGVRVLTTVVTTNANQTVTYKSNYNATNIPNAASISLTFAPPTVVTNAAVAAPFSLWDIILPRAIAEASGGETPPEIILTLESGYYETRDIPPKKVYFDLTNGEQFKLQSDDVLPELPSETHICSFVGKDCNCVGAKLTAEDAKAQGAEEYRTFSQDEFYSIGEYTYWIDTETWPNKIKRGNTTYYVLKDEAGASHYLHNLDQTDAWASAIEATRKTVNDWLERCQLKHAISLVCDQENPQHDWGDWTIVSESASLVVYKRVCNRCGEEETNEVELDNDEPEIPSAITCSKTHHIKHPTRCGCLCGKVSVSLKDYHRWAANTCICKCGTYHADIESPLCSGICNYCARPAKDGIASSIAAAPASAHTPCTVSDGRCGCKCNHVTHVSEDPNFHIFAPGACRCLGSDGTGGVWHRHLPKSGCKGICAGTSTWGIEGPHTVAHGNKVASMPGRATALDHTKVSGGRCGCECGEYTNSNADEWKSAANLHNDNPLDCGCYCGEGTEGQLGSDFHKFAGDTACLCFCGADGRREGKHRKIAGSCTKVCFGSNHGDGMRGGLYAARDEDGKSQHTPKNDSCGCACGKFSGGEYLDESRFAKFHNGGDGCICDCGRYHRYTDGSPCSATCKTCDRLAKNGFTASVASAEKEDHDYNGDHCGCKCAKHLLPHKCGTTDAGLADCYCIGDYAPLDQRLYNILSAHSDPVLMGHVNLQPTGNISSNQVYCSYEGCGNGYWEMFEEYECQNSHIVLFHIGHTSPGCAHPEDVGCNNKDCECEECHRLAKLAFKEGWTWKGCECGFCSDPSLGSDGKCMHESSSSSSSTAKFTAPVLTAADIAAVLADIDWNEVFELDGDDPVYEIAPEAFRGNLCNLPSLTTIKFNYVTNIGAYAFQSAFTNCPNLASVQLSRLTKLGAYAFNRTFAGSKVTRLDLPKLTSAEEYGFLSCTALKDVSIPNLTDIPLGLFYGCYNLTRIDCQPTKIGDGAFWDCRALTYVNCSNVVEILPGAFGGSGIKTLHFPNKSELTGMYHAFLESSLTDIYFPAITTNDYHLARTVEAFDWANTIDPSFPSGCTLHFSDGDIVIP